MSLSAKIYAILPYALTALLCVYLLINAANMVVSAQLLLALFVILSSVNLAWLMENRSSAIWLEWCKHGLILLAVLTLQASQWLTLCLFIGTLISIFILVQVKRRFNVQDDQSAQTPTPIQESVESS